MKESRNQLEEIAKSSSSRPVRIYFRVIDETIKKFKSGELDPYKIIQKYEKRSWFSKWFSWGAGKDGIVYDAASIYNILRVAQISGSLRKKIN